MSTLILFFGTICIVIGLFGMLIQSKSITSKNRDIRKLFYYYIGTSVAVCVTALSTQFLLYFALGILMLGTGLTMYVWKLNKEFKRLKSLDEVNKFIEKHPELFIEEKEQLKLQILQLNIAVEGYAIDLQEKAVQLKDNK